MKKTLPNGCAVSELSVYPSDWHTKKAKVTLTWYIKYRFYDPLHRLPKQVMIKGMNAFKTLKDRLKATKRLLDVEMQVLVGGFNPFTKSLDANTNPKTLIEALQSCAF